MVAIPDSLVVGDARFLRLRRRQQYVDRLLWRGLHRHGIARWPAGDEQHRGARLVRRGFRFDGLSGITLQFPGIIFQFKIA